jgi:hypothetical protein
MNIPNLPSWATYTIYVLAMAGALFSPEMFPNPMIYKWVQFVCALAGVVNHKIAAGSNPDGTPASVAYDPLPPVR